MKGRDVMVWGGMATFVTGTVLTSLAYITPTQPVIVAPWVGLGVAGLLTLIGGVQLRHSTPIDEAYRLGYDLGYEAGWHAGYKAGCEEGPPSKVIGLVGEDGEVRPRKQA